MPSTLCAERGEGRRRTLPMFCVSPLSWSVLQVSATVFACWCLCSSSSSNDMRRTTLTADDAYAAEVAGQVTTNSCASSPLVPVSLSLSPNGHTLQPLLHAPLLSRRRLLHSMSPHSPPTNDHIHFTDSLGGMTSRQPPANQSASFGGRTGQLPCGRCTGCG